MPSASMVDDGTQTGERQTDAVAPAARPAVNLPRIRSDLVAWRDYLRPLVHVTFSQTIAAAKDLSREADAVEWALNTRSPLKWSTKH